MAILFVLFRVVLWFQLFFLDSPLAGNRIKLQAWACSQQRPTTTTPASQPTELCTDDLYRPQTSPGALPIPFPWPPAVRNQVYQA